MAELFHLNRAKNPVGRRYWFIGSFKGDQAADLLQAEIDRLGFRPAADDVVLIWIDDIKETVGPDMRLKRYLGFVEMMEAYGRQDAVGGSDTIGQAVLDLIATSPNNRLADYIKI